MQEPFSHSHCKLKTLQEGWDAVSDPRTAEAINYFITAMALVIAARTHAFDQLAS